MASLTTRLLLRKPGGTDLVNVVTDLGDNFDKIDKLPGGEVGYVEKVTNQGGITAITDIAGLAVTFTPTANRRHKLTIFVPYIRSSVAGDNIDLFLLEGATILQGARMQQPSGLNYVSMTIVKRLIPTAAAHTYKVAASRSSGTGTVDLIGAATSPISILAEDIGGV